MKLSAIAILGLGLLCANAYAAQSATGKQAQIQAIQMHNKMMSDAFLANNKTKPGVVTLPDGLQYKVITQGNGAQPRANDIVTVNYAGTLINGAEFDSSYRRGQPATFALNGVIPGWREALQLMRAGSTWEIFIPSELAYGEQGVAPSIAPNQTLIFIVNLIDVKKP